MSHVDVGFRAYPYCKRCMDDPLETTRRFVLFLLFLSCVKFAKQLDESDAFLDVDTFFMQPPSSVASCDSHGFRFRK